MAAGHFTGCLGPTECLFKSGTVMGNHADKDSSGMCQRLSLEEKDKVESGYYDFEFIHFEF